MIKQFSLLNKYIDIITKRKRVFPIKTAHSNFETCTRKTEHIKKSTGTKQKVWKYIFTKFNKNFNIKDNIKGITIKENDVNFIFIPHTAVLKRKPNRKTKFKL